MLIRTSLVPVNYTGVVLESYVKMIVSLVSKKVIINSNIFKGVE